MSLRMGLGAGAGRGKAWRGVPPPGFPGNLSLDPVGGVDMKVSLKVCRAACAVFAVGWCAAALPLRAQTYRGVYGPGLEEGARKEKASNESRAEEMLRDSFESPRAKRGKIPPRVFLQLWEQGVKDLFAKDGKGGVVQVREYDLDGTLRDVGEGDGESGGGEEVSTQSAVIVRQLDEGLYLGTFSNAYSRTCAFRLPGMLLADGDVVSGQFKRVGVYRYGTQNLAQYALGPEVGAGEGEATGAAGEAAGVKEVYKAFHEGKVTFVMPGTVQMECLTCEGSGREYDEAALQVEAEAAYRSKYNRYEYGTPRRPYSYFYSRAKKKTMNYSICDDCRGKKKVPVRVFVRYALR